MAGPSPGPLEAGVGGRHLGPSGCFEALFGLPEMEEGDRGPKAARGS